LLRVLDDAIYGLIEQQQHQPHETNMISLLLAAQSGDGTNAGLTRRQIRDEVTTFFIAGQETIANVIAWAFYLLGRHPAARAQLAEELDRVLGGKLPTAADIPDLVYTRMVFAETMRLFPSVWAIGRSPLADDEIGGYQIPAGSLVFVSQWVVHRHPDYWPEPNLFKPQRFHPDSLARTRRPRYAYFPFGGGPRLCIGEHYAWMEGILMIATLAQRFQFKIAPQAHVEPQPLLTLRLKYGLPVIVQQRTTSVPSPG
jgi:cytochrome P450